LSEGLVVGSDGKRGEAAAKGGPAGRAGGASCWRRRSQQTAAHGQHTPRATSAASRSRQSLVWLGSGGGLGKRLVRRQRKSQRLYLNPSRPQVRSARGRRRRRRHLVRCRRG